VPAGQMMRFIKYYIDKGGMNRHEQSQHFFAVAFYIHEAFGGNEKAKTQAAKYLKDSLHGSPSLEEMAKAILTDLTD
jgi:hypothetical protein